MPPAAHSRAIHRGTTSKAILPPPELRQHLICLIERDTRGCSLSPLQALTYGTATTNMALVWYWSGWPQELEHFSIDDLDAPRQPLPARLLLVGGRSKPWVHHCQEALHCLLAVFRPDAMRSLFGIEPADWLDRSAPLTPDLLPKAPGDWAQQILDCGHLDQAQTILTSTLHACLSSAPEPRSEPETTSGWMQRLSASAETPKTPPLSLRTMQRQFKRFTGFSQRSVLRQARMESLAIDVAQKPATDNITANQLDLANRYQFADQSHLGRDMRAITGFGFASALRRSFQDESFWLIRTFYSLYLKR